jgi:hypothetical protein
VDWESPPDCTDFFEQPDIPINAMLITNAVPYIIQTVLLIHLSPFARLDISIIEPYSSVTVELSSSRCRRPGGRTVVRPLESEPFYVLTIGINHIDLALSIGRRTEY